MLDPGGIDSAASAALSIHSLPGYWYFFSTVTWLGEAALWMILLLGYLVVGKEKKIAAVLLITLLFGVTVNENLKDIVQRPRPNGVMIGNYLTNHNYSFPSGHVQTAFTIATVLTVFLAWRYNIITYLLAVAVGFSRIYLGVHYLTDVIAGAAVGILLGELAIFAMYRFGLCRGGGIIGHIMKAVRIKSGRGTPDSLAIKYGIACLAIGFLLAQAVLLMSLYALSLAVIAITYVVLFFIPAYLDKNRTNSGNQRS